MLRILPQHFFIFFYRFVQFAAFGQRITLIIKGFAPLARGKGLIGFLIIAETVKAGAFPVGTIKFGGRSGIILIIKSPQAFLIVIEEKTGLSLLQPRQHKQQHQDALTEKYRQQRAGSSVR